MINDIFWAAIDYWKMGFSVIPIRPRQKQPQTSLLPPDSANRKGWEMFQSRRASYDELSMWFETRPSLNIAIVTGKISNLVVIDLDGELGQASWKELLKAYPALRPGGWAKTASGYHAYFAYPPNMEIGNRVKLLPGIDIRGEGGYVVAPPSVHPSGKNYEWSKIPHQGSGVEALPAPLVKLIMEPEPRRKRTSVAPRGIGSHSDEALELLNHYLLCLSHAPKGNRNHQLNCSAYYLARVVASGALSENDTRSTLTSTALDIGLEEQETKDTINSAFKDGLTQPWIWR